MCVHRPKPNRLIAAAAAGLFLMVASAMGGAPAIVAYPGLLVGLMITARSLLALTSRITLDHTGVTCHNGIYEVCRVPWQSINEWSVKSSRDFQSLEMKLATRTFIINQGDVDNEEFDVFLRDFRRFVDKAE
jgi:hypothetical protein